MPISLCEQRYSCTIDHRVIVLDADRSRYYLLPSSTADAATCDGLAEHRARAPLPTSAYERESASLANKELSIYQRGPKPTTDVPRLGLFAEVSALLLERIRAGLELKRSPIGAVFKKIVAYRANRRPAADPSAALGDILAALDASSLAMTVHDRCLPTSIALCRRLARRGVFASLNLGVRLDPFAAHAWLEFQEVVILDDPDIVAQYTRIAVV